MRKETILFVTNNPGSVNAVAPVIKALHATGRWNIVSVTSRFGKGYHQKSDIHCIELDERFSDEVFVGDFIKTVAPKVIITGSGFRNTEYGNAENYFRKLAGQRNIYSVCIVDHWKNYRHRFSSTDDENLDCLPDTICVMDEVSREQMIDSGIPEHLIKITGQPHFERLRKVREDLKTVDSAQRRASYGIGRDCCAMTFVSEPLTEDMRGAASLEISEYDIVRDIIRAGTSAFKGSGMKPMLIIRLHPRERRGKYASLSQHDSIKITEDSSQEPHELLAVSDIVIGMTSLLLIESYLLNLRTLSYQPCGTHAWTTRLPIPVAVSYDELHAQLSAIAINKDRTAFGLPDHRLIRSATRNICNLIEGALS